MPSRERSFWAALALVLYLGVAHWQVAPEASLAWASLVFGPLVLLAGWRLASEPPLGADWIDPTARRAAKAVAAGVAVTLVAECGPARPSFAAARALGLGMAAVAAPVAVTRIRALGGSAKQLEASNDAAWVTGLLWLAAFGLAVARVMGGDEAVDGLTVDYATLAAALGGAGIGMVAAFRVFIARRHELGVAERAAGALWLGVVCLALGALGALMEVAPPERAVPLASLVGTVAFVSCAVSQRPALVARALRMFASVTMLATPLMSVAVVVAYKAPTHAGAILFVVTATAVGLGMLAPRLAERMAPARGKTLRALERATLAAKAPEPRQAVVLSLSAIRDAFGTEAGSAALYRFATSDRLTVDRAGYLHVEHADVPEGLVEYALGEPERILGTEVLREFQVRRREIRPWVAWLDDRGAGAAALLLDETVPLGLVLWPAAGRVEPLSYEEVRALRVLADHLATAAGAEASLDRTRERAIAIERERHALALELEELRDRLAREEGRQRAVAAMFAERARRGAYGPAAQMGLTMAEHLGGRGEPLVVVQRPGGDPLAWAAVAHLASPHAGRLMLVVDGLRREEHLVESWLDGSRSPLELARGGTLVLVDAQGLPRDVQRVIGTSRRPDVALIAILPADAEAMLAAGVIDPHFAALFGDRVLSPPRLAERGEDLRALALAELARLGTRLRGEPLGLSLDAQRLVLEYGWPGNEAELAAVLLRAALATSGAVVGAAELSAALGERRTDAAPGSGPVRVGAGVMR